MTILTGLHDLILILCMMKNLSSFSQNCKSQSIIFWVGMGMLNSLFCFMNLICSTLQNRWMLFFFTGTLIHFVCLYQIVLKIIHKIALVSFLETNQQNPTLARRNIAIMHMQIYCIILLGLLFGINSFPNKIILLSIPVFFYFQIFAVAY